MEVHGSASVLTIIRWGIILMLSTSFNKALAIDDRNGDAWNYKGLTLHRLGRYQEAIEAFNRGLIIDPRNAEC